jgi:hypothetical protein
MAGLFLVVIGGRDWDQAVLGCSTASTVGYRTSTSAALPVTTVARPASGTTTATTNGSATAGASSAAGTVVTGAVASTRGVQSRSS